MTSDPLTVLHIVGGLEFRGGAADVVKQIASLRLPGVAPLIWMHRDYRPTAQGEAFVLAGKAVNLNRGILSDLRVALIEILPLFSWARRRKRLVLHAHNRPAFFVSCLVHWLTGTPLVMHVHVLANQPWLYRLLGRLTGAEVIYNSRKTCLHFGDDPDRARIVMPSIRWPETPPPRSRDIPCFIGCGAFVPSKNFALLVAAFRQLRAQGVAAGLQIFGLTEASLDPVCQNEIVEACRGDGSIRLRGWTPDWTSEVTESEVFVHLGQPESFGIVVLEAFAKGCKLIVLPGTFLDDLPAPSCSQGIDRLKELTVEQLAQKMKLAVRKVESNPRLWEDRKVMRDYFSLEKGAASLAAVYESLTFPRASRSGS